MLIEDLDFQLFYDFLSLYYIFNFWTIPNSQTVRHKQSFALQLNF